MEMTKVEKVKAEMSRARWTMEMKQKPGQRTLADLTPERQELIYWSAQENEAYHMLRAAELEKVMLMEMGITPDYFDFSQLNWTIIEREDRYHECKKKADRMRDYFKMIQ